jgi:hypothetical protein
MKNQSSILQRYKSITLSFVKVKIAGCAVGLAIYKITVSKAPAYDWIPAKDRAMFEQLIAANNKDGIEIFLEFISLYGLTGYIKRLWLSGLPLLTVILTLIFSG